MSRTWVYLIGEEGTNYIKVGITRHHPADRLSSLQTGNPRRLVLRYAALLDYRHLAERVERAVIASSNEHKSPAWRSDGGAEWLLIPGGSEAWLYLVDVLRTEAQRGSNIYRIADEINGDAINRLMNQKGFRYGLAEGNA